MTFHLITLFPEMFDSYLNGSILGRAIKEKKINVKFYNPRNFAENKWNRVDRPPYGGGPGMVMEAMPIVRAIESALSGIKKLQATSYKLQPRIVFLSPSGKQFTNEYAKKTVKKFSDIIIVCGRYEGVDARVKKIFKMEEISVGPFVVTGGELPAMIMIDAMSRQTEGVLHDFDSLEDNRVSSPDVYTRPDVIEYKSKKFRVPKVLLEGNHKKIEEWKKNKRL
jgi:tRNA (guanine37-N1)-methyltransferase